MSHPLESAITGFLAASAAGDAPFNETFLDACLESIKLSILDAFHGKPEREFRLRMSNIGRDVRQLMLEKEHGRGEIDPTFLLKMLSGSLLEHILVYILRSAGVEFAINGKVSIVVDTTTIDGEWDLKLKADNKIYDVKTCSEYAYNNKFIDYATLAEGDSFGYVDQLLGYAEGEACDPGGWLVFNKSTGQYKVIEYPYPMASVRTRFLQKLKLTIDKINSGVMPSCFGVEPEMWYKKPTQNLVIGKKCRFCSHKKICHPTLKTGPSKFSRAKDKPIVHYVDEY